MLRMTTALLLLSPAIASAQCLTAASLDAGITVEYGSGDVSHIERLPNGTILDAFDQNSRYSKQVILFESADGVVVSHVAAHRADTWEARTEISKSYDFTPESLAPYTAGMRGVGTATWEGSRYSSGDKTYSWMGFESEPLVVGDCSYEAVRVFTYELSISRGDFYVREIKYLPELGFGLQTGNSYFGFRASNTIITSMTPS